MPVSCCRPQEVRQPPLGACKPKDEGQGRGSKTKVTPEATLVFHPRLSPSSHSPEDIAQTRVQDKGQRRRERRDNPCLSPSSFTFVFHPRLIHRERSTDKGPRQRLKTKVTPEATLVFRLCLSPSSHSPRTQHRQGSKTKVQDEGKRRK